MKLVPQGNEEAYGRFEEACSVEQSYFAAAAETLGTELFIKKCNSSYPYYCHTLLIIDRMRGLGPPDEGRVAQAEADLELVFARYDQILAKQRYLTGDDLTLVDLFHLPNGAALKAGKWVELFTKYPNVGAWFGSLQERESWTRAAAQAKTIA